MNNSGELNGRVAIVTGGAQGIGKAIALTLARHGADVVVTDINLERAQETVQEIEALQVRSLAIKANVADVSAAEQMVKETVDKLGKIDILVNNAGITRDNVLLRMKPEEWDQVMEVNLKGTYACTRAALKFMFRQKNGRIVNIASITGLMGNAGQANYSASKAGIIGFTKAVAREYANRGITVNAVAPGLIDTAMTQAIPEKEREALTRQIPMERLGTPDDVAAAVYFLVSDLSGYITGQVINVNGGMYM
ncbi:MAG TPA: 3-oxoacyl-[acyl-carrier-protein] reductase [Thermodesulfobacteriota bacterium]|nr:3-oxoacyl-[acyl-carrier-protein] reductase [Thermodesulfobacteriota bacterium]